MMSIQEKQQNIVHRFSKHENWEDRYKMIIQMGKELEPMEEALKTDQNRIKGCQSQVWLHAKLNGNLVEYVADSDAVIVKGLAAILIDVFSGQSPQDIMASDMKFLADIGLTSHLSQSRANGLGAMVKQLKNYAVAFNVLLNR